MKQPDNLKLRPIIAWPSCQTHWLSNLLDIYYVLLKPFTEFIRSYVRDDIDFLNHLPKHIPKESFLVSFDVESLYSSIPHIFGLQAIEYFLDKYPSTIPKIAPIYATLTLAFLETSLYSKLKDNYGEEF